MWQKEDKAEVPVDVEKGAEQEKTSKQIFFIPFAFLWSL